MGIASTRACRTNLPLRFFGVAALLFAASATLTIIGCTAMASMGELPMPGGWTLSMAWMPMCGQTWPDVVAAFLGMWLAMMVAMMLPSLLPVLWRCHAAIDRSGHSPAGRLIALMGAAYFTVWLMLGAGVLALGGLLATVVMQWPALARAVPIAGAAVVVAAGALQFTGWKARHLAGCRATPVIAPRLATSWRHGLRLGLHCSCSCAGPMAILLVGGVMDLRMMAIVTMAITIERLAPDGRRAARTIGTAFAVAGLLLMTHAAWPG
jgi:predicted metal-binding membrane protein